MGALPILSVCQSTLIPTAGQQIEDVSEDIPDYVYRWSSQDIQRLGVPKPQPMAVVVRPACIKPESFSSSGEPLKVIGIVRVVGVQNPKQIEIQL